ncbi:hypothetical protein Sru01_39910 [Sphaerisporangium rufum]|uniref:Uncharacterized protein n=1 Tax=Sphaerisporangium rufum TaxID=1381558 RepID=A0A919R3Q7_9ACTN|nr:hypothetical protein Sru01_39910 [Sphaerisporangium rufum]
MDTFGAPGPGPAAGFGEDLIGHRRLRPVDLGLRSLYHVKWVDSRGFTLEALILGDRPWLRVRRGREYVAYYASVAELSADLDLADLVAAD